VEDAQIRFLTIFFEMLARIAARGFTPAAFLSFRLSLKEGIHIERGIEKCQNLDGLPGLLTGSRVILP